MKSFFLAAITAVVVVTSAVMAQPVEKNPIYFAKDVIVPYMDCTIQEAIEMTDYEEPAIDLGAWKITFYCPCEECCGIGASGITASEVEAVPWHTVATDQFEFGTKLQIEGLGEFVVEDRGVYGEHIDVFVSDHQEALNLGEQTREVYLIGG